MTDDLGLEIGAKVKAIRSERGLSGRKLAAAAQVSQGDFWIEPGPDVDEWFESADETVIYVIEGSLHVEFQDRPRSTLHAGDVMFHSAWVQTRWRLASESPARVVLVAAGG